LAAAFLVFSIAYPVKDHWGWLPFCAALAVGYWLTSRGLSRKPDRDDKGTGRPEVA
jgi:hypothetical protein